MTKIGVAKKSYLSLLLLNLIACSDKNSQNDLCPITVDSVAIIDTRKIENETYYLVHRISGWSDKTEILELHDSKPVFDNCSKSNIEPIYGDSLESEKAVNHVYLNLKDKTLVIEYKDASSSKTDNTQLKIEPIPIE